MENRAFAPNAPFSILFSKSIQTKPRFFLIFSMLYKIENDVDIQTTYLVNG